jgi:Holliday junction resolvase RusA-like endonuclease
VTAAEAFSDLQWAERLYGIFARGGDDERLFYRVIHGDPWSKSRPRFSRNRTYQPRDDRLAEEKLRTILFAGRRRDPFPGNVMLACRFYRSNFQRIDTDNLLKHVCDSATGVLWKDDSQVTLVLGETLYDPVQPRTIIAVGNHASTLVRGEEVKRPCDHCGKVFLPSPGRRTSGPKQQRFCSTACNADARRKLKGTVPCKQCGEQFPPRNTKQVMCSPECRVESLRNSRRAKRRTLSRCTECGKELTHSRGGRCRDCWRADPQAIPARRSEELVQPEPRVVGDDHSAAEVAS